MALQLVAVALALAPLTIAVPGINGVRLAPGEADLYGELLSNKLTEGGLKVYTARDVGQMLGVERQQQLLGCSEGSNCVVEMVGALGVDGVLIGDIGALGDEYVLNFKVLSAKRGGTIALYNGRAPTVNALPDELAKASRALLQQLSVAFARPDLAPQKVQIEPSTHVDLRPDRRPWAILPGVAGIAAVVTGIVFELLARGALGELRFALTADAAQSAASKGATLQTTGFVLIGVGGAAALAAVAAWTVLGRSEPQPTAAIVLGPNGATFTVQGSFP